MPGYVKLFTKILDSTIWTEDSDTKIIWITLLAMADRDGVVECTIPGLAGRAKVSLEKTEQALERFQNPDKYSWSQEEEGRRIRKTDRGWELINYERYREMLDADEVREKARLRQERRRARLKKRDMSQSVTPVTQSNDMHNAPPYAYSETIKPKHRESIRTHFSLPSLGEVTAYCQERKNNVDPQQWFDYYTANGWKVGKNSMKDWRATVRTWERNGFNSGAKNDSHKTPTQRRNAESSNAISLAWGEEEGTRDLSENVQPGTNRGRGKGMA